MIGPICPLNRAHAHEETLVTCEDIATLRAAAKPKKGLPQPSLYSDALLSYVANAEMCSTVSLAWCLDPYDQELRAQQERFKEGYAQFRATIAGLNNNNLRFSVELPEDYVRSIEDNRLLDYAQPRDGGRPTEWRKDEFYIRILTLYKLFSGKKPSPTEGGPTVRFMRAVVLILRRFLDSIPVQSRDDRHRKLDLLWRVSKEDELFLREWFRTKAKQGLDIQSQVNTFAEMGVSAYVSAYRREPSQAMPGNSRGETEAATYGYQPR